MPALITPITPVGLSPSRTQPDSVSYYGALSGLGTLLSGPQAISGHIQEYTDV